MLPAVLACAAPRFDCLAMVKPQFEVGRERVGKGGVVRDAIARRAALVDVGRAALGLGASVLGFASSGLPGPKGNRETFVWLAEAGRGGVANLEPRRWRWSRERVPRRRRAHPPATWISLTAPPRQRRELQVRDPGAARLGEPHERLAVPLRTGQPGAREAGDAGAERDGRRDRP